MQKLKMAYFGSPSFSASFLEKIINDKSLPVEVKLVITQPDMPVGRKQVLTPTPVKLVAEKYQLPITNDQSIINNSMINENSKIENCPPAGGLKIKECDLALVYAYGEILPREVLDLPKFGFWNIHPSLLPKYRGASPISYPLVFGDKKTGVSLILMDEKMDHGPIIAQDEMEIGSDDTRLDLESKLTDFAFKMIKNLLLKLSEDTCFEATWEVRNPTLRRMSTPTGAKKHGIKLNQQNHSQATYTQILKKSDGFIPLSVLKKMLQNEKITTNELPQFIQEYYSKYPSTPPLILNTNYLLLNLFRGLSPWPGLWTLIKIGNVEKRLKIIHMELHDDRLTLTRVQLENKNPVDFITFNTAYKILP